MRDALHAEWTKLRTLASTFWLLLAAAALTVTVSAAAAAATRCPSGGCADDPAKISLTGIYLGQAVVAVLAVMAVSGEYGTGMIRLTLAAMPRRVTVLAAKAAVLTGLVLVTGTVAVACLAAGRAAHPARPRHRPGPRLPGALPRRRAGAPRRLRLGPLPRPDRPAQPRRRHRPAGGRRGHRGRSSGCSTCSRSSPPSPATRTYRGTSSRSGR